jgi:hypothetical protein
MSEGESASFERMCRKFEKFLKRRESFSAEQNPCPGKNGEPIESSSFGARESPKMKKAFR